MKLVNYCFGVALILSLAGCATPQPPVKDILTDPEAHLATNFTVEKLSESVRDSLGIKVPGKVKHIARINEIMTVVEGDNKQSYDKQHVYYVLDNGLVRSMIQASSNGISSLTEFELSYHNVFNLIYQSVSHLATTAYSPTYTKQILRLDKGIADPKESNEYIFEYALAPEIQVVNFKPQKTICKTGKWFPVNTLHPKLTGLALPIDCDYLASNGQTFIKMQSVFIKDLGVSLLRESVTTRQKRTWKITDVR